MMVVSPNKIFLFPGHKIFRCHFLNFFGLYSKKSIHWNIWAPYWHVDLPISAFTVYFFGWNSSTGPVSLQGKFCVKWRIYSPTWSFYLSICIFMVFVFSWTTYWLISYLSKNDLGQLWWFLHLHQFSCSFGICIPRVFPQVYHQHVVRIWSVWNLPQRFGVPFGSQLLPIYAGNELDWWRIDVLLFDVLLNCFLFSEWFKTAFKNIYDITSPANL